MPNSNRSFELLAEEIKSTKSCFFNQSTLCLIFKLNQLSEYEGPNYTSVKADFVIYRNDQIIAEVFPEKRLYNSSEMPMTEAGIAPKINGDLYITLGNLISENKWSVRIYFKPMVRLIWLGAILMFIGGIISILTRKQLILSTK